jgi:gamma-polyglutamate synthase
VADPLRPRDQEPTAAMPLFTTSDDAVLLVSVAAGLLLFLLGVIERLRHRRKVMAVPLRASVNGSRGKSTVTRLLTGALAAGGYRVLGKTTGTEPRMIRGWSGEEIEIRRRPEGPNISEQRDLFRQAADDEVDSVVAECMAVQPEYQTTFHRDFLDVNLAVITNALDDHLEEMGPTSADVADVFADQIPHGGTVAVLPGPYLERFRRVAEERDAKLLVGHPDDVDPALLDRFEHVVLDEHVALVLAVTRHLGIDDDDAIAGMLAAPPDPFAARILPVGDPADPALFVNAFAANDPESTRTLWQLLHGRGKPGQGLTVVMNCRADRIPRTQQFARDVLPSLPVDTLVVTGQATKPVLRAADRGQIRVREVHDLTGADTDAVMDVLDGLLRGRVVLGVGNLHGGGVELVDALEQRAITGPPSSAASHRGAA